MENTAQQAYQQWLTSDAVDDASKQELEAIASDSKEIEERFYRYLAFGTAGMRGIIGAGNESYERLHRAPRDAGAGTVCPRKRRCRTKAL